MNSTSLTRFSGLSIATALLTMGLKRGAWWLTGSVGLPSDDRPESNTPPEVASDLSK